MWIGKSSVSGDPPPGFLNDEKPNLVYVPWSGLGDLIMALPVLVSLRDTFRVFPVVQKHHARFVQLLQRDGLFEEALPLVSHLRLRSRWRGLVETIRHINRIEPEATLIYGKVLPGLIGCMGGLRSQRVLFSALRRPGFNADRGCDWRCGRVSFLTSTGNQMADHRRFAQALGVAVRPVRWWLSPDARGSLVDAAANRIPAGDYAVVAPWASEAYRSPPPSLIRSCIETVIRDRGIPVVLTGTPDRRAEADALTEGLPQKAVVNLVGLTAQEELLGILAGARLLISGDSGNMHLAALVGTPMAILFGPTAPETRLSDERLAEITALQFRADFSAFDSTRQPLAQAGSGNADVPDATLDARLRAAILQACD